MRERRMKRRLKESKIYTDKQKYSSIRQRIVMLKPDICYSALGIIELEEFKKMLEGIITRIEEKLKELSKEK
jgi:predicted RNase H-like nuclease